MRSAWFLVVVAASAVVLVQALDNGLGLLPQMGYSSWNDCGSNVSEAHIKAVTQYFIDNGLVKLGYNYINVDEGWLLGRDPNTLEIIEDKALFPSGMKGLGEWIHNQDVPGLGKVLKYGLYTCRGPTQCAQPDYRARCMHNPPNPATGCMGSNGYEHQDARWIVNAGADYLKEDSCSASQIHAVAFDDYAKMRDALNATGRPVFFSLCGWNEWYAPPDPSVNFQGGASLGNSWRIHGDGRDWGALSDAVNTMANITAFTGPGGWNDPDLLIGPKVQVGGQTSLQARTQFSLWALFPAPLLISQNVLTWTNYSLATYSNKEVIAVNQAWAGKPGRRVSGGNLSFPCSSAKHDCENVWARELPNNSAALVFVNNDHKEATIACDADCFGSLDISGQFDVLDLWTQTVVGTVQAPFSLSVSVPGHGGCRMFRLVPK